MAGPAKKPEKKQASLTSFFTPRTINGLSQSQKPPSSPVRGNDDTTAPDSSRKRPLQENSAGGNDNPTQFAKRVKGATAEPVEEKGKAADTHTSPGHTVIPKPGSRTERYVFDAAGAGNASSLSEEHDDLDAAAKRKKEELHKKFVKKLGHPDSLVSLRRRNFQGDSETTPVDGEDGEGGEDEEDEAPAPAKTKKKGAKTGKLTPMEIQFLDIKRKHMDTLLIVEVGYKFKFFGEDARIAAKELSIVCIPGKFRYDERESSPLSPFWFTET